MGTDWLPLESFPRTGRTLILDDQRLWEGPIAEFGLSCRIAESIRARMLVLPQDQGVLFRGALSGTVILPCVLCTEDSLVVLEHNFDSFESFPAGLLPRGEEDPLPAQETDDAVIRLNARGGCELNPAALAWEEFSLALPVNPLCREDCKGLCPVCGANRNRENCSCPSMQGASGLACLRGIALGGKRK
ncbi:MAG: DUF177 domain-containing protein [Deltaproteobacteria bacterium]|jgi:uncharacterized protein|nr:DUF177 domain-containing protein [Deltaproteobacteria bacterium]